MLADGFGRDPHSKALSESESLGKLGGIPGAFLRELAFDEGSRVLGDERWVARSRPIEEAFAKPRSSQRSRSRPMLALERPV